LDGCSSCYQWPVKIFQKDNQHQYPNKRGSLGSSSTSWCSSLFIYSSAKNIVPTNVQSKLWSVLPRLDSTIQLTD